MLAYVEVDCPGKLSGANELLCQLLSNFLVCPSNFLPVNPKVMGMPPGQQFQNFNVFEDDLCCNYFYL